MLSTLLIASSLFLFNADGSGICSDKNHEVLPLLGGHDRYILCLFRRELIVLCPPGTIFDLTVKDCVPENPTTTTEMPPWLEVCKEGVSGNQSLPESCVHYVSLLIFNLLSIFIPFFN